MVQEESNTQERHEMISGPEHMRMEEREAEQEQAPGMIIGN